MKLVSIKVESNFGTIEVKPEFPFEITSENLEKFMNYLSEAFAV